MASLQAAPVQVAYEYAGPERRLGFRRTALVAEELPWRLMNLALSDADPRRSFGRRASDYVFLTGLKYVEVRP